MPPHKGEDYKISAFQYYLSKNIQTLIVQADILVILLGIIILH